MVLVFSVSILVLMEVSLRHDFQYPRLALISVSILVLMEVSLRLGGHQRYKVYKKCFNPCFNGSISETRPNMLLEMCY